MNLNDTGSVFDTQVYIIQMYHLCYVYVRIYQKHFGRTCGAIL